MARYRNFRTFTSPKPAQFSCLSIDVSGDLVAAGAQDTFDVYLWSLQTGRLLEVLRYNIFSYLFKIFLQFIDTRWYFNLVAMKDRLAVCVLVQVR